MRDIHSILQPTSSSTTINQKRNIVHFFLQPTSSSTLVIDLNTIPNEGDTHILPDLNEEPPHAIPDLNDEPPSEHGMDLNVDAFELQEPNEG